MKQILLIVTALLIAGIAPAQRLQVGLRAGVNTSVRTFSPTEIQGIRVASGPARIGFDMALLLRLNITRHFLVQAEAAYAFTNYGFHVDDGHARSVVLNTARLEFPVGLGVRIGKIVRLFGGVVFRAAETSRTTDPTHFDVHLSDPDVGVAGGIGLDIGRFFIDLRVAGFTRSSTWNQISVGDTPAQSVRTTRNITCGGTIGLFF